MEEAFIAERGTPFLLSPKDWTLIRGWREGGIPVDVVIRAVREAFEKRRARGQAGKISSIAYCASSVEELWEMERRGLVGKTRETPVAGADAPAKEESFALLASRLRAASQPLAGAEDAEDFLRKVREKAAARIDALPREGPFEESESALAAIEAPAREVRPLASCVRSKKNSSSPACPPLSATWRACRPPSSSACGARSRAARFGSCWACRP